MGRKYPEPVGPHSQTAAYAWLFGMLASAYSTLDQYEQQEEARECERMRETLSSLKVKYPEPDSAKRDTEGPQGAQGSTVPPEGPKGTNGPNGPIASTDEAEARRRFFDGIDT